MFDPHLIPSSLLILFTDFNIPLRISVFHLEKSLSFPFSASNSSPVTKYKGFCKTLSTFYAYIILHPSTCLLRVLRCMLSIHLFSFLLKCGLYCTSSLLLCRALIFLLPLHEACIPQNHKVLLIKL